MRFKIFCLLTLVLGWLCWAAAPGISGAAESCRVSVDTILAARDDSRIDPQLKTDISELQSMFNYTSYRLLGRKSLNLGIGQSGTLSLPGDHSLRITPKQIRGSRADIALEMMKNQQTVFQTRVQLLNRGNLFVGGPDFLTGNLIFKISSAY